MIRMSQTGTWTLAPSAIGGFLLGRCARCFHRQLVHRARPIGSPPPRMLADIEGVVKDGLLPPGAPGVPVTLPDGTLGVWRWRDRDVRSRAVALPNGRAVLRGKFDLAIELADRSYALVDLKGGPLHADATADYAHQLRLYKYALEHAADARPFGPISRMYLLGYRPAAFVGAQPLRSGAMEWAFEWRAVSEDEEALLSLVNDALLVLNAPFPPLPAPGCVSCAFHDRVLPPPAPDGEQPILHDLRARWAARNDRGHIDV